MVAEPYTAVSPTVPVGFAPVVVAAAYTFPTPSIASPLGPESPVSHVEPVFVNIVVLACVKKVDDAIIIVLFNQSGVVVLWFATPL